MENEKLEGTANGGAAVNRVFSLQVMFDRKEMMFSSLNAQGVNLVVSEEVKNKVLEQFHNHDGVISVQLSDGLVRHINVDNILYIDEKEIVEEGNNGK